MWGANSTGKSFASAMILKEAVKAGYSAYCILANELKSVYISPKQFDADNTVVDRVVNVDFLLIEDIGKEYSGKGSGWAELNLENLLRRRSRELKPVIITTNLSPTEFKVRYKSSASAIVKESMIAVEVKGKDLRTVAAKKKLRQMFH